MPTSKKSLERWGGYDLNILRDRIYKYQNEFGSDNAIIDLIRSVKRVYEVLDVDKMFYKKELAGILRNAFHRIPMLLDQLQKASDTESVHFAQTRNVKNSLTKVQTEYKKRVSACLKEIPRLPDEICLDTGGYIF